MSHLTILPTVLRDADRLTTVLTTLGLQPQRGGSLEAFPGDTSAVLLQVRLADGQAFGWQRQSDGSLALVCDLQRLSRSRTLAPLIGRITRAYAAHQAIESAALHLPGAAIELSA